jgi:hypothetical protein
MSDHTPGPWQRVDVSTGSATKKEQLCNEGYAALLIQHDGSKEGEANARLIAAAPELLEAVEALLPAVEALEELLEPVDTIGNADVRITLKRKVLAGWQVLAKVHPKAR